MNPQLAAYMAAAEAALHRTAVHGYRGAVHTGVDLGTANTTVFVLDADYQPLVGTYRYAEVVRDGLVVDFAGATSLLRELKQELERRLGFALVSAATTYPPGVPAAEVRATRYVLEAAGLECSGLVDEPTAANAVLEVENGAVIDIGGGTTGIAIVREGQVIYTADEATGGTHFTLVLAGAHHISFGEAERLKLDVPAQKQLFPIVRPVMEKVATIVARHVAGYAVDTLYLVGGTSAFYGIDEVIATVTGIHTVVPTNPLFVTPLGVARHN